MREVRGCARARSGGTGLQLRMHLLSGVLDANGEHLPQLRGYIGPAKTPALKYPLPDPAHAGNPVTLTNEFYAGYAG
jgi:hypothetical protein